MAVVTFTERPDILVTAECEGLTLSWLKGDMTEEQAGRQKQDAAAKLVEDLERGRGVQPVDPAENISMFGVALNSAEAEEAVQVGVGITPQGTWETKVIYTCASRVRAGQIVTFAKTDGLLRIGPVDAE